MAQWIHTYRPGQIAPQGTIDGTQPGRTIAQAVTEIQDKALTEIELALSGALSGDVTVEGNTATISLDAPEIDLDGFTGELIVVVGASYSAVTNQLTLSRRALSFEDGLYKSETSAASVIIQLADGLPSGGAQRQVLQRGAGGVAVWDWVKAASGA